MAEAALTSLKGEEQRRPHPDGRPNPRVQTSPGPPPWRKHTIPATQKGRVGAPQTGRSPRAGSSQVEGSLPPHCRQLRLLLLPPGGTVGLKMVSPCDVGHRAWTASWGRCAGRHPQPCQLRGLQLHGQRTWPPHGRTPMMTHTGQGFFSDSFGKRCVRSSLQGIVFS